MLVQRAVIGVGFVDLACEVVDVGFEVGAAVPSGAEKVFEFVDVAAGFVAVVKGVLFAGKELLAEGLDSGGCVSRVEGGGTRGGAAADEVVFVFILGWWLGGVEGGFGLFELRLVLETLGAEFVLAFCCGTRLVWRCCSSPGTRHGRRWCRRHVVLVVVLWCRLASGLRCRLSCR